jgi:hypothetical protein
MGADEPSSVKLYRLKLLRLMGITKRTLVLAKVLLGAVSNMTESKKDELGNWLQLHEQDVQRQEEEEKEKSSRRRTRETTSKLRSSSRLYRRLRVRLRLRLFKRQSLLRRRLFGLPPTSLRGARR